MNDNTVIHLENITKKYRLYNKPIYRLWDIFGFINNRYDLYKDHWALNGINLSIKQGERVAIIGRNGAGKSTLLKLISGVIEKTSGNMLVKGNARALLQLGTGFHMDLTGRDNAQAYLIQLGISDNRLDKLMDEIIDFSELEEYIDQPVKTYSSGMLARLMFATSTAITPDLLILDEILSVGDAYFTHKSMERIQDICRRKDSTMLLVSHDVYSAAKMVDRMIWVDGGKIVLDDNPQSILRGYEDSIRVQEEARLRKKALFKIESMSALKVSEIIYFEFVAKNNVAINSVLYFSQLALLLDGEPLVVIEADAQENSKNFGFVLEGTSLGEICLIEGKKAFSMLNYGSVQHKICFYFKVENAKELFQSGRLSFSCQYFTRDHSDLVLKSFVEDCTSLMPMQLNVNTWTNKTFDLKQSNLGSVCELNTSGRYGAGNVILKNLHIEDLTGERINIITFGQPVKIKMDYKVVAPNFKENIDIILSIMKNGVETACRFFTRDLEISSEYGDEGVIELDIEQLTLGYAEYTINLMIARSGYADHDSLVFFTLNPAVYFAGRDLYAFRLVGEGIVPNATAYVATGTWSLCHHDLIFP